MKTHYSNVEYARKVATLQAQAIHINPPAILFRREPAKHDEEAETKKIKIRLDPESDEDEDKLEVRAVLFESGDAEAWVKWRIQMDELIRDMPLGTPEEKSKVAKALLKGDARERFVTVSTDVLMEDDPDDEQAEDYDEFEEILERMGRHYFPTNHAYRRQKNYLRYHVFMMDMPFKDFKAELIRQNQYLRYFPQMNAEIEVLSEDELVEIIDRAKRVEWQRDLLTANIDPYGMSLDEYSAYLEKLEVKHKIDNEMRKEAHKKKRASSSEGSTGPSPKKKKGIKPTNERTNPCKHCGKMHLAPDNDCWSLKSKKEKRPGSAKKGEKLFTNLQLEQVYKALEKRAKQAKKKKRQISFHSVDSSADNSSESDSDYSDFSLDIEHTYALRRNTARAKPVKQSHGTTEVILETILPNGVKRPMRGLLDTGSTKSIILAEFAHNYVKSKTKTTETMAGRFLTKKIAQVMFKIPELSHNRSIKWSCHVDETTPKDKASYDIILGLDLINELGLKLDFKEQIITWDELHLEMKKKGVISESTMFNHLYQLTQSSPNLKTAEDRQATILDADYSKVEVDSFVETLSYLTASEKEQLGTTLKNHPILFGGGLGKLNIEPIH